MAGCPYENGKTYPVARLPLHATTGSGADFRCFRIGVENGPERRLQRAKPRLVIAPAINAFLEDRAAHLFVADRVERAIVVVEFETGPFKGQLKIIEHSAHFRFEIGD